MAQLDVKELCKLRSVLLLKRFRGGGLTAKEQRHLHVINCQLERIEIRELAPDLARLQKLTREYERVAKQITSLVERAKTFALGASNDV